MNFSILYYPYIEFQRKDYDWLLRASLFWDNIYRIVPDNYRPEDDSIISQLTVSNEIGVPIYTKDCNMEIPRAAHEFINGFQSFELFSHEHPQWFEDEKNLTRIHFSKFDYDFFEYLYEFHLLKKIDPHGEWYYIPKQIGDAYMHYLATEIAFTHKLDLCTREFGAWKTDADVLRHKHDFEENNDFVMLPFYIQDIIPQNGNLHPDEILKFREKTTYERHAFMSAISLFTERLRHAETNRELEMLWEEETEKFNKQINAYKNSMRLLNVTHWGGKIMHYAAIGIGCAAALTANPVLIGLSTGLEFALRGVSYYKRKLQNTEYGAYSYLCQIENFVNH